MLILFELLHPLIHNTPLDAIWHAMPWPMLNEIRRK